jgi:hypothetical protein
VLRQAPRRRLWQANAEVAVALLRWLFVASLTGSLLACGSDPVNEPDPGPDKPLPAQCDDGPNYYDETLPKQTVGALGARLLADGVEPAEDVLVFLCGVDVCSQPAFSDESGDVSVAFRTPVTKPAFKYGDGFEYVELALLIDEAEGGRELGELYLPRLPETGAPIAPGQRSESNGVAIELAENASTDLEELLPPYDTPNGRAFRAVEVPLDELPEGIDQGAGLELVFGLAPLGATLCPAAELELPNSAGWAPGTRVEFLLEGFGVTELQFWAPYGEWAVFASGEVSASGEKLVTVGEGLPLISNVGVRRL